MSERVDTSSREPVALAPAIGQTPNRARILARLRSRPTARGAAIMLAILVAAALFAPFLAPQDPYDLAALSIFDNRLAPGAQSMDGAVYWLGTDSQGRDMLSAILYGLRISLVVGLSATAAAATIGTLMGLLAAYVGGLVETAIMRVVDFILGFPTILVALILLSAIGRGVDKVILAIVIVQWAQYARIMRGSVLVETRKEYVEAARNFAIPGWRIMLVHLLPNALAPILVVATVQVASAIMLESTLSFLGVGVPITEPSLGLLIASGFEYLLSGEYWISFFPGLALVVLVFSINLVGDRLRESIDPRRR
ncbi:peptide ABC transporter permease [Salinarimonas ramus]|uniref:Peptide ABC transporter permease n=1 Tax=Salinarimonas ramus TaxID=690164 RepID=A0A917Q468_9HYPH|nr:peptide ABC transporter permease [Salinarimonas ramus]